MASFMQRRRFPRQWALSFGWFRNANCVCKHSLTGQ